MSSFDRQGIPLSLIELPMVTINEPFSDVPEKADQGHSRSDSESSSEFARSTTSDFTENMALLQAYALVSTTVGNKSSEMYGLIQLATRSWLELGDELET